MSLTEIRPWDTGRWLIVTITGDRSLLEVPLDGRTTWWAPAPHARRVTGAEATGRSPTEVVAWGSYNLIEGLHAGICVGDCLLLVTEPLTPDGFAPARLSTPVASIAGWPPARQPLNA